jgi:tetratricopeptide (TPR) repeat protein
MATAEPWIEAVAAGGDWQHLEPTAAVEPLCEAAAERVRSDLAAARRLTDAAMALATGIHNRRLEGLALRCHAILLWAGNRFPEALSVFELALAAFEAAGEEVEAARTRSNAIQTLIYLSRYEQAMEWGNQARKVFAERNEPLRLARLEGNLANLLYRQDRFEEAIHLYEQVQARFREIGQARDVAAVLRNKAVCQLSLSRFEDALQTHQEAREFCLRHGMKNLVAEADYNIAYLHFLRGDYLRAKSLYDTARRAAIAGGDAYHEAVCDLDEAELNIELNLPEDAEQMARQATAAFRRLKLGYEEAKARVSIALSAGKQGRLEQALRLLRVARRQFVAEQNAIWPPLIDLYVALLLEQSGKKAKARSRVLAALGFFSPTVLPGKAIHCRLLLARVDLDEGRLQNASVHVSAAERLLPHAQSPALAGYTLALKGRIQESLGNDDAARAHYLRAEKEFEALRDRLRTEELRISFFQDKVAVYEHHFRLLMQRDQVPEAFATAERAKSRSLGEAVTPRRPTADGSPEAACRRRLDQLYRELEAAEFDRSADAAARVSSLRERILDAEGELRKRLATVTPGGEPQFIPQAEEVAAALGENSRLVEYFRAGDQLYAFVLGGGRLVARRLGSASRVLRQMRFLQFHLSRARFVSAAPAQPVSHIQEHLRTLYEDLIAPLREHLNAAHCVVVPHGFLHSLPFHALYDGTRYLSEQMTFSTAPSAAVLCRTLRARRSRNRGTAVFGIGDGQTPEILEECRRVAATSADSRLYLNEEATAERLREAGANASILHIATHGRFRQDNPWFSAIRLGDGYLSLFDLYELRLETELVVLSGCSTGLSVVMSGDETVGLVRGVLQAGSPSAVVSLWDVSDRSTAQFMESFYGSLRRGESAAAAVRQAQAATREAFPHPYHWAAFSLVGRWDGLHL